MAEERESRMKYIGQLVTLFALEILMLLFRIAVPIGATIGGLRGEYQWLISEVIYMVIEGFLIIILVNHLIFKNAYKEMGIISFKENIFSLLSNLCYLGIAAGITYALNYISGGKSAYSVTYIITHVLIFFVSTAFLQEVIYRGCILNNFLKLTGRKAFLSILGATLLFMLVHVPLTMLETNFESLFAGNISQVAMVSFGIGLYLSLLYYWTNNLWICIIIHGTYSCINVVADGLLQPVFKVVYILGALIYLLYAGIHYMKGEVIEDDEEDNDQEQVVEESISQLPSTEEAEGGLAYQMIQGIEELGEKEAETETSSKTTKLDEKASFSEDLNKTAIIPMEEQKKDLSKTEIISLTNISEDLSKTVIIPAEEQKKDLSEAAIISLAHQKEDLSKTTRFPIEKIEQESSQVDLNQTAIINLKDLEAIEEQEDLSKTAIIKVADLEAEARNSKPAKKVVDSKEGVVTKFKEEPSYMNHLERSLGEFESIYKQITPTDPPIDILSFQGEKFNALVTNGMRYLPMNVPEYLKGNAYAELVMFIDKSFDISDEGFLKEENSWLLQSLRDLAMYPRMTNSYLGWGHAVGNGEERTPYYSGSELCGMLIYPPVVQEDMKFYTFKEGEKTTYIYNVMPLYTEEIDFILKHSGDAYFDRIRELGISQVIKKNRPNACLE